MPPSIAALWRSEVVSVDQWDQHLNPAQPAQPGEAGGFFVRSQAGIVAYLKPTTNQGHPRAANEKICSDLAFDLKLPVPPAVLYRRPNPPGNEARHVALSYKEQGCSVFEWQHLFSFGDASGGINQPVLRQMAEEMLARCSPMVAFDVWLGNTDRHNARNAIVVMPGDTTAQVYFIDFANSLGHDGAWANDGYRQFRKATVPPFFLKCLDRSAVERTAAEIAGLPDATVTAVVGRIPEDFLELTKRTRLADDLIWRKANLLAAIGQWYP